MPLLIAALGIATRRQRLLVILLPIAMASVVEAGSPERWSIGMPIVTYWAGPGTSFMPADDLTAAQLRAGGWNLAWASAPEQLDLYHRHGLRAMLVIGTPEVDDPEQAEALLSLIEQVRNHPALYAYWLADEPATGAFPALGRLVAFLRQHDPAHLAYINLYPTYATAQQLQVSDEDAERARADWPLPFSGVSADDSTALRYAEYLRQYVQIVNPALISYDHYHFLTDSDGGQYFLNLALIRRAALRAGVPFLNIIQNCGWVEGNWREPSEAEMRWLTYTSLAYGAQGICHFRYDLGFWKDAKDQQTFLPRFWGVAQLNREFVAVAQELQNYTSIGVYHWGAVPWGAQALPEDSVFRPETADRDLLIGLFGRRNRQPTHAVVVNLNYEQAVSIVLDGPRPLEVFHAPTGRWTPRAVDARLALDLPPGGGVLVRARR